MAGGLEGRTRRLVDDLSSPPVSATDVEAERISGGVAVVCSLEGPKVNMAQRVASAHGFTLHGKEGPGRYRFAAYMGPGERADGRDDPGGFTLPGGVR